MARTSKNPFNFMDQGGKKKSVGKAAKPGWKARAIPGASVSRTSTRTASKKKKNASY